MTSADLLRIHRQIEADAEIDNALIREFESERRHAMERLKLKTVTSCFNEFKELGFAGFEARVVDGELWIEGVGEVPVHLREKGAA